RHTRFSRDWSSDVCSSDLVADRHSITTLRVRYAETDAMQVAYYANYFVWFEVGRTDLLRQLGWTYREMEEAGILLPVTEADCRRSEERRVGKERRAGGGRR